MALINTSARGYYADPSKYGKYQFTALKDIINQFVVAYVGEDKLIPRAKKTDVAFHAQRAMQELSFDTFKSIKAQEFTVPTTLTMPLPQDYVNYTKISLIDSAGIKRILYPTSKTSNPSSSQHSYTTISSSVMNTNSDTDFAIKAVGTFTLTSNDVVLDGDYDNIITGMNVYVEDGITSNISNITTASGITTITMGSPWSKASGDRELEFRLQSSKLIPKTKKTARITGSYTSGESIITASSTAEAAKVEVGMFVIDDNLPHVSDPWSNSPKVIDVQGDKITINNNFTDTGASVQINFISYDFDSETWDNYKSNTPSENNNDDYEDDTYWPNIGKRYGLDPQHAQINGSYYINEMTGKIHFSSNISGKTVIIDYISDTLGSDTESHVHKLAEEAMYKYIAYAMLSTRPDIPERVIRRYKKEKFAEIRKAKLRLSNIKLEEITQILRGKSKRIKH